MGMKTSFLILKHCISGLNLHGKLNFHMSPVFTNFLKYFYSWCGVKLSLLVTLANSGPTVSATSDDDECGAVGGMRIKRED
jgi:hypothetical protein